MSTNKEQIRKTSSLNDVRELFNNGCLSQKKKDKFSQIINILGEYMIIDRDILNYRAEEKYGEKIGLSFIKKAVELRLITELQDSMFPFKNPDEVDGNHFYYTLAAGGMNLFVLNKTDFRLFNDFKHHYESRLRVLQFNYMAMGKNLKWIKSKYSDSQNYLFFHCNNSNDKDVVAYFPELIDKETIQNIFKSIFVSRLKDNQLENVSVLSEQFISKFDFKTITSVDTTFTDNLIYDSQRWNKAQKEWLEKLHKARDTHSKLWSSIFYRKGSCNPPYNMDWDPGDMMTPEEKTDFDSYKAYLKSSKV